MGSRTPRGLPRTVWALGFVSLLMDASSELVHSLLPLVLAGPLGASMTMIGLIEGLAEATAQVVKVFSGALSDRFGKRKLLALIGYGLAALSKPVFPLAGSVGWVVAARIADRIGKGIRGAPRDALIAEVTPAALRGAAFGLRQSLDSVGAFVGPLLAIALLMNFADDLQTALWFAVIPAVAAVLVLALAVTDAPRAAAPAAGSVPWRAAVDLPPPFWGIVTLGVVFTLARFSEAFLVLYGQQVGLAPAWTPAVLIALGVVYALVSYPAGLLADRRPAVELLGGGMLVLLGADLVLAHVATPLGAFVGAGLWGAHLGLTQGLLSKLVADTAPAARLGTAFGVFNLASGIALLLASVFAGALWQRYGPAATFHAGGVFATLAAGGLAILRWRTR